MSRDFNKPQHHKNDSSWPATPFPSLTNGWWHVSGHAVKDQQVFLEHRPCYQDDHCSGDMIFCIQCLLDTCSPYVLFITLYNHIHTRSALNVNRCSTSRGRIMWASEVFPPSRLTIITMIHLVLLYKRCFSLCVSAWGDQSVSKWGVSNYEHKQTTPHTCVLVCCNEGDTACCPSTKGRWETYQILIFHPCQASFFWPAVKSNHHYCKSCNTISSLWSTDVAEAMNLHVLTVMN